MNIEYINVIGLGYIGLPTAIMLAQTYKVIGTDINSDLVESLKIGRLQFEEKGLARLFDVAVSNHIQFTTEFTPTDFYIIAVPTPYNAITKKLDSSYVVDAFKKVLEVCKDESIIVIESTIAPGTVDKWLRPILDEVNPNKKKVHLAHAPERIIPGNTVYELINNNRTIGVDEVFIGDVISKVYSSFCKAQISITDIRSAEMSKIVENTFRDINIAYANELARICHFDGLDVYEIIKLANNHPRVNILQPGPGVGGHCIPVDPWFLVGDYPELTALVKTARLVNDSMPTYVRDRIFQIMSENHIESIDRVGLYGLSYKENVDDIRESPTIQLMSSLDAESREKIRVFDPYVKKKKFSGQYTSFDGFIRDIDLVVIMTKHDRLNEVKDAISKKIVFDTRKSPYFLNAYSL